MRNYYSFHIKTIPGGIYDNTYFLPEFSYPDKATGKPVITGRQFTRDYSKSFVALNSRELAATMHDLERSEGFVRILTEGPYKRPPIINQVSIHCGPGLKQLIAAGYDVNTGFKS